MAEKQIAFRGWQELATVLGVHERSDPYGTATLREIAPGIIHLEIACDLLPAAPPADPQVLAEQEMYHAGDEDIPF